MIRDNNLILLEGSRNVRYYRVETVGEGEETKVLANRIGFSGPAREDSERMFRILEAQGWLEDLDEGGAETDYVVIENKSSGEWSVICMSSDQIKMKLIPVPIVGVVKKSLAAGSQG